ncbi:hypothetical protein D3C80_1344600 [compost metagenome]
MDICSFRQHRLGGKSQNSLAFCGSSGNPVLPVSGVDRLFTSQASLFYAKREKCFRSALYENNTLTSRIGVQCRHVSVTGIKGDFIKPGPFLPLFFLNKTCCQRKGNQRALHWVTKSNPMAVVLRQNGIVAKQSGVDEVVARRVIFCWRVRASMHQQSLRLVSGTCHIHDGRGCDDASNGHFIFGQRTGLVGTNDGGCAKRFHGWQTPDHRIAGRHALDTDGKCNGDNRWQAFRHDTDGQCHNQH